MNQHKIFIFSILISLLYHYTDFSQQSALFSQKETKNYWVLVAKKDSIYAKNLKALSKFTDTIFIEQFYREIEQFQISDSLNPNQKTDIVFTGSSSIRKWKNLSNDISGFSILNRGFGGSSISEVIFYSDILIFKHQPKKIVLYAGENDISTSMSDSLKVVESFKYFEKLLAQKLPEAHIYFISIKPSPARRKWWTEMQAVNKMIKEICLQKENCTFVDVSTSMLDANLEIRNDIFVNDKLHLNEKGYQIWAKVISEAIKKN